jgi:WD40 repeat protein
MEQLLEECPADLRGWEWRYLKRLRVAGIAPLRHSAALFSAAFSPDDRWIVSGSQDGKVTVWDASTSQEVFAYQAHHDLVRNVAFSPDGRLLATAGSDKTVKVWSFDPTRGAGAPPLIHTLPHQERVHSVVFSPDSQRLASAGEDKTVRVWDAATGHEVFPALRRAARQRPFVIERVYPEHLADRRQLRQGLKPGLALNGHWQSWPAIFPVAMLR